MLLSASLAYDASKQNDFTKIIALIMNALWVNLPIDGLASQNSVFV
jgi:hypothetical protein